MHDTSRSAGSGPVGRPATGADVYEFYGESPPPKAMRAWVAELDGRIVGIGGLYYGPNGVCLFSEMKDELRPYKKFIVQSARFLVELARPLQAAVVADANIAGSERLLERLGLLPAFDVEYGKVFRWTH